MVPGWTWRFLAMVLGLSLPPVARPLIVQNGHLQLADHPDFVAMGEELEADIATQRQWYFENRDTPIAQL